jgi:transposase
MPKIIRVSLTPEQRAELNRQARAETLAPRLRDRIEMIRLSDLGHTIPQIARALDQHEQTVRKYVKAFLAGGFAALPDAPRPGKPATLTGTHLAAVEQLLDEAAASGRMWTAPLLVRWLHDQFGITISEAWLSERLKARKFRWKRTQRSVRHKQKDPDLQAQKEADLEVLKL